MTPSEKAIQELAEQAVREAGGDWSSAGDSFRSQVLENEEFKATLLDKIVLEELRQAARRLGETTRKCPLCGEIIALDAVKCRFCGEWVDQTTTSIPRPPAAAASSGPVIRHFTLLTGWVLIVLIIILIITFAR